MKEQTRNAIDLLLRGATRFGGVLRQHFKAKTAPDCETGSVVEKEVSRRGLASLDRRVERIASQLARVEKNADRGGRALTNALDDFEREYNALSRGAKRYCRRSDAWIASQRKFTAFALGYLRGLASAPQGGKRATEAPAKAESPRPEAKPQTAPQKPAAKVPEGSRELPTAEDCRDRGTEAFKGKYAVVQAIACCVHAAARDHGVKPSEFRITRARGSHLSLTVRMVRTGRAMRFTGTTTPKGYRSACASVTAFFSSLAKAAKKDETPTVKPNYPKTRTVQTALASHGLRAESTMPADLLALEYSAYTMTSADQDRIADEHRAMVERLLKKGVEIDPRVAAHYNLAHVEHAPVVPSEPTLTTEQLSELTEDQRAELARLETMPLDDAQTEYQRIAKAARFVGGGIDAVFRGKHRFAIVENKREIQEMKGRNEDLPEDKRLTAYKGTAHDGTKIAVDYWIIAPKSVPKAEAEKVLGDYLDVLDAAGHQGRSDIVSLWTKTMRALGYSDALIRMNHLKDAAKRILSKRRAEASKEATTDVKWVRVDSEQNVVRLKFGRKPAAGSEKALQAAGYGLVSRGHENPYWRATWSQKARDAALAVGANAADLPEIAAPKPVEKPAPKAEEKPVEAPAPAAPPSQVEAAPAAEASKPDANMETQGAKTDKGPKAAVGQVEVGDGITILSSRKANPRDTADDARIYRLSNGREALVTPSTNSLGDLRYSALIGELEAVASTPEHAIRKALKNPTVRHGEELASEAPVAAPSAPAPQPAAQPAKDPALQWHKPVGSPCSVCGVSEPRLKALHRMLSPEEQDRTGCKYLKSVKVSFGGDSEETCIGERVPRIAAAKRLSAVLLQPSGFTKKDIYDSDSTSLGAENLQAAMENLRRDGVLVRDYSSNMPPRTGYETREELEKLTAEMSKEKHSTWHVVGVSEQGVTADGAANVLKTIRALGLPDVEVMATIAAIQQPAPTDSTDEAVRRAAEKVARELGFELEPEAPAAAPTPEPPAPPVESPEEKRARELAERFANGLSGRMGGKTLSPPSTPESPAAPASREMSAQEKANAEMAAFLEEWGN